MGPIKYTDEDIQHWAQLYSDGFSFGQIATQTGANRSSVVHHLYRLGLRVPRVSGRKKKYEGLTAIEVRKQHRLKKLYGIGLTDFNRMLAAQGGLCAICRQPPTEKLNQHIGVRGLHVDHDHATGAVRGLLCTNCNGSLGKMKDSPELLRAAADYLEFHRAPERKAA